MSFDGVWQVEVLGPYGWEEIGTAFLVKGQYLSAGKGHHSVGRYSGDGGNIEVTVDVTQHGSAQTVFGETKKHIEAMIEGRLEGTDSIVGKLNPRDSRDYDLKIRLTRLGTLE